MNRLLREISAILGVLSYLLLPAELVGQSEFAGVWTGTLNPGGQITIEISASGLAARLTFEGVGPEILRYVSYNSAAAGSYFWREQDHAGIGVFRKGNETVLSYLEEGNLRTATLVRSGSAPTVTGTSPIVSPTSSLLVGAWSGSGENLATIDLVVPTGSGGSTFKSGGLTETLQFLGFNPEVPSVAYWREVDHAFIFLYAKGAGHELSYLEEDSLRTAPMQRAGTLTPPATDPGGRGEVSFVLTWGFDSNDEGPDIDLHVIDPNGAEWDYNTQNSAHFDLDDRGASGAGDGAGPERAYWDPAPSGNFSYFAFWYSGQGSTASYADVTLRVYRRTNGTLTLVETKTERLTSAFTRTQRWTYAVGAATSEYTLGATTASFGSSGGTGNVEVSGGTGTWSANSNTSWISISSGNSGSSNGSVRYSVASNSSSNSRTGTMTIAGQTFTVSQSGTTSVSYSISPTTASFGPSGGSGNVSVAVSGGTGNWSATSSATWISINGGSTGTSSGTVGYSVASNSSSNSRTGTMTIAGQTFTVSQSGTPSVSYSISPTTASFGSSGGGGNVLVAVSGGTGNWSATSGATWISINGGSTGTSSGTVGYSVASNSSSNSRTGTMTIAGQTFTVTQSGSGVIAGSLRVTNTSTRVQVGTGANVLITGVVLSGTGTKRYLARGIGPTLSSFGVAGTLVDPLLTVFNAAGVLVAQNDNWDSSLAATFSSIGAFALPAGSRDAALVVALVEGAYTFQISGVGGTSGVALVEVYELP